MLQQIGLKISTSVNTSTYTLVDFCRTMCPDVFARKEWAFTWINWNRTSDCLTTFFRVEK